MIAAGAAGAFAGDNLSYALGRFVGRPAQERFLRGDRTRDALGWAEQQLAVRGGLVLIVGRYVPGGRTAVTFTAGLTHYPYSRFAMYDVVGGRHLGDLRVAARLLRRTVLPRPRLGRAAPRVRRSRGVAFAVEAVRRLRR